MGVVSMPLLCERKAQAPAGSGGAWARLRTCAAAMAAILSSRIRLAVCAARGERGGRKGS
eukprot:scaffold122976_cov28-Tisochrysis_lutea.AAC.4